MPIQLKSKSDIEKMRAAGRVVRSVLDRVEQACRPGVTTGEIDEIGRRTIEEHGARGLFKNYPTYKPGEGFPGNLCISVNEVIVHGIGDGRVLEDGDIIGVDCGVKLDGWCGDSATTILVGDVDPQVRKLCDDTRRILQLAIDNIRPGRRWSQIARTMQKVAESEGYGVVREFVGHGVGRSMHEEPKVPNFVEKGRGQVKNDFELREGLVIALEPMCNLGTKDTETLSDGWTVVTADRKPSAHYEHTVAVTADGCDVLTDGR